MIFFMSKNERKYSDLFTDNWHSKLAYLADTFENKFKLDTNMQGSMENVFTSADKIADPMDKIKMLLFRLRIWVCVPHICFSFLQLR